MKMSVAFVWLIAIIQSSLEIDLSKCGSSAGCLRSPEGCNGDSCTVAALWSKGAINNTIDFEITAKRNGYISIGFSEDENMGDDSVIDCINNGSILYLQASYNKGRSNEVLPLSLEAAGLTLNSSSSTGGFITCKFTRKITVPGQKKVFDLSAQEYYVMLAFGSLKQGGEKQQHSSSDRIRSSSPVNLMGTKEPSSSSKGSSRRSPLHKTHGVLMIAAWAVFAAMGMFIARHYKPAWPTSTLLNTKVWFVVHRSLMVLALLCTVVAFILIFVQVKDYTQFSGDTYFIQAHPPMGIAITALVIVNPIMTFFRCHPGAKNRAIFDWAHFSVGMSALILSFINVFSGVKLGGFKDSVMWVMAAYIAFYIIVMLVMEVHKWWTSPSRGKSDSMEMSPISGKDDPSPSTLTFKYSMLVIFFLVSIGLFAVMLILIVVD